MKNQNMVIAESNTAISRSTYYFTKDLVYKLEGYSRLVSYFLILCVVLITYSAFEGANLISVVIGSGLVVFILAFMILWVYPKENVISDFSMANVKKESSAKKIQWKNVSHVKITDGHIIFWENEKQKYAKLKGNSKDAVKFLRSKLGK